MCERNPTKRLATNFVTNGVTNHRQRALAYDIASSDQIHPRRQVDDDPAVIRSRMLLIKILRMVLSLVTGLVVAMNAG
jgi:hypothetical protein